MNIVRAIIFLCLCVLTHTSLSGQLKADFKSDNTQGCGSLRVSFLDQSTGANGGIVSYKWDLGVARSSLQNPGAIYTNPGKYTICLTVTDKAGTTDKTCKEEYIQVFENPTVDFTTDAQAGCAPVDVTFQDKSSSANGAIASWQWDVGGSANIITTTDPTQPITTTYTTPGNYSATLTVKDDKGCTSTKTLSSFVNVSGIDPVDLDISIIDACQLPWTIKYTNLNVVQGATYTWDFGNGDTYTGPYPPEVKYTKDTTYTVKIYMQNGACRDTSIFKNVIDASAEKKISASTDTICLGGAVTFSSTAVKTADRVVWDFGDGRSTTRKKPTYTYASTGCFTVNLYTFTGGCSDTVTYSCIKVLDAPTVDYDIYNNFNCQLPNSVSVKGKSNSLGKWKWSFTEQKDIEDKNATFTVNKHGAYYLSYTFTSESGCTLTKDSIPFLSKPFEAKLPVRGPRGCTPLTFTLQDSIATGMGVQKWEWRIKNGMSSNDTTSTFTIQDTGRYDVTLIVTNDIGCMDTIYRKDYIRVGQKPEVDFVADPLISCKRVPKLLTDKSSPFVDEWYWLYNDTVQFSQEQNPEYIFPNATTYDITLIASHNGCVNQFTREKYITVNEPISKFSLKYKCDDPYNVSFVNKSTGVDELKWTIYTDTSLVDSIHYTTYDIDSITFPTRGKYPIRLWTKNDSTGCEDIITDTIRVVDLKANYTIDTLRGCAPFTISLSDFTQDAAKYEYIAESSTIDTTDILAPEVTFTEGGILLGPTLVATDIHGCQDTFRFRDSVIVNKLDANILYNKVACVPSTEDYIDNSTDLLGNIIEWSWKIGDTLHTSTDQNTSYTYDTPGEYRLEFRVKDDWGCTDSIILKQGVIASMLEPDFTFDSISCTFSPIQFKALGAHKHIDKYLWEFSDGKISELKNPKHLFEQEGVYSVSLTMYDKRGCSKMITKDSIIIIKDPIAKMSADPTFSTCPPLVSTFTNNSVNAHSYTWDFGDNSGLSFNDNPGHVYTFPGKFDVTLIATWTPTCHDTLTLKDYIVIEGPEATFKATYTPSCLPQKVSLSAQSDEPYKYVWDYGNGELNQVQGLVMSDTTEYIYTETGLFTPKIIVEDSTGCTRSFSGEEIRLDLVELSYEKIDSIICGAPPELILTNTSTSTTDEAQYTWSISGPVVKESTKSNAVFTALEPGVYDLNLAVTYDGCNDTITDKKAITIAAIPKADFDLGQDDFCENIALTINNTSSITHGTIDKWHWILPQDTSSLKSPSITVENRESKTITLIATSDMSCMDTIRKSFDVLPSVLAAAGDDILICMGENTELKGSLQPVLEGSTYYWNADTTLSCLDCLDPIVNTADTASYVFTAVHPNGCLSHDTVTVNIAPTTPPIIELSADSIICVGDSTIISITNYDDTNKYTWNPFQQGLSCYQNCQDIIAKPSKPTTYTLVAINEYQCKTYDSIKVDLELEYEEFAPDRRAVCEGGSLTLGINKGKYPIWETSPELNCTNCFNPIATPKDSTYYTVSAVSPLGCRHTDSIFVATIPPFSVQAGKDTTICSGETIVLNGTGYGTAAWTPSENVAHPDSFATAITPKTTTEYILQMTDDECTQKDTIQVILIAQAELTATGDTICYGEEAKLKADGKIDKIVWMKDDEIASDEKEFSTQIKQSGNYTVYANYRSCSQDTATVYVHVYDSIAYSLPTTSYTIYTNDDIDISPIYDDKKDYSYTWTPSDGLSCNDCPAPEIRGVISDKEYSLYVIDNESLCTKELEIELRYIPTCNESVIQLPNIFAPGRPGENSTFGPITENKDEFISLTIFDRWGNKMYYSEDVDGRWDGYLNNQLVAEGVYVCIMQLICPETNKTYQSVGDVTVIR